MDLKEEEKKYKMEQKIGNMLLEALGGDKDSPTCFRVLRAEKKLHDKTFDLLKDLSATDLMDSNNLKPLLTYFEQGEKILNDIEKKIKKESKNEN